VGRPRPPLQKTGLVREAADAYDRAIRLAGDDAVKRFLLDQRS
jgi:predicted RNA polymerase sigma factor